MNGIDNYLLLPDETLDNAKLFGFKQYVKTITRCISDINVKTPLTISIHGKWGSGKSSLMSTIANVLDDEEYFNQYFNNDNYFEAKKSKLIWFNAWKYESEGDIGSKFLHYIGEQLKEDEMITRKHLKKFLGILGKIAVDTALRRFGNISLKEIKRHIDDSYSEYIANISNLSTLFSQAVNEYIENTDKQQIIFFIDDIDRCSIENSKSIIDIIRLFLSVENCIFIIGLDIRRLQCALNYKYGKIEGEESFNAKEYIDKIIQLRFELPTLSFEEMREFIKNLLPKNFPDNYIEIIAKGVSPNPRNIKLFINNLRFQLLLSRYQPFKINDKLLVKWLILKHSYPELASEIEVKPQLLLTYLSDEMTDFEDVPPERKKELDRMGINFEYLNNEDLMDILHEGKTNFTLNEIKNIVYQTQTTQIPGKREFLKRPPSKSYEGHFAAGLDLSPLYKKHLSGSQLNDMIENIYLSGHLEVEGYKGYLKSNIGHFFLNPIAIGKGYLSLFDMAGDIDNEPIKIAVNEAEQLLKDLESSIKNTIKEKDDILDIAYALDKLTETHYNSLRNSIKDLSGLIEDESITLTNQQVEKLEIIVESLKRIAVVMKNWKEHKIIRE